MGDNASFQDLVSAPSVSATQQSLPPSTKPGARWGTQGTSDLRAWTCSVCTFINTDRISSGDRRPSCAMCSTERQELVKDSGNAQFWDKQGGNHCEAKRYWGECSLQDLVSTAVPAAAAASTATFAGA